MPWENRDVPVEDISFGVFANDPLPSRCSPDVDVCSDGVVGVIMATGDEAQRPLLKVRIAFQLAVP